MRRMKYSRPFDSLPFVTAGSNGSAVDGANDEAGACAMPCAEGRAIAVRDRARKAADDVRMNSLYPSGPTPEQYSGTKALR